MALLIKIDDDIAFYASSAILAALLVKQVPDAGKSNFAHDRNYGVTMLHGPEPCITMNFWIFSEIDRPLNFNDTFVSSSVFDVVSINDARFFAEIGVEEDINIFIYFVCNSEEKKTLIFHIYYMLKYFLVKKKKKQIFMCICDTNLTVPL